MEPTTTTDPIMYLITGGGAIGGYVLSRLLGGKNGNSELTAISQKIDQTNELLRSQARLEGILSNKWEQNN